MWVLFAATFLVGRMGSSSENEHYKEYIVDLRWHWRPFAEYGHHCTTSLLSSSLRYDWDYFSGRIQEGFIGWIMVAAV